MTTPNPKSIYYKEPNLLTPGKKPVGSVKIDWSHPLARNLEVCIIFQSGAFVDLTKNKVLSVSGTASEITRLADGSPEFAGNEIVGIIHDNVTRTTSEKWSIFVDIETDGDLNEAIAVGEYNTTLNYIWFRQGSYIRIAGDAAGAHQFDTVNQYDTRAKYQFNCDVPGSSSSVDMYIDGEFVEASNDSVQTAIDFNCVGSGYSSKTYSLDGRIYNYAIYSRSLTASEIRSLHNDPYQFLIPA